MNQPSYASSSGGYLDKPQPAGLAEVLELVLDKGVVIAGDIQIKLLDIEVLTIKLRLLIASVDKAREMGINWWESDSFVSSSEDADGGPGKVQGRGDGGGDLERRVRELEQRLSDGESSERRQEQAAGGS
jgi:hypothetical protein